MSDEDYGEFGEEYFVEPDVTDSTDKLPEDFFEEERRDLIDRIDKLEDLIEQRKKLLYDNLEHITEEALQVSSEINNVKEQDWSDKGRLDGLAKTVFQLESQKRSERVNAWNDVWTLLKELLATIDDYKRLTRTGKL